MTNQEHIRVFDSQGEAYKQAFQIFLDHTDQKRNAKRWLQQVVDDLPTRKVFIDAGAGNGEVHPRLHRRLRPYHRDRTERLFVESTATGRSDGARPSASRSCPPGPLPRAIWCSAPIRSITSLPTNGSRTSNASCPGCPQPASPSSSFSIARVAA